MYDLHNKYIKQNNSTYLLLRYQHSLLAVCTEYR